MALHGMAENNAQQIEWEAWLRAGHPLPGEEAHLDLMPFGRTSARAAREHGTVGKDFREASVFIGIEPDGRFAMIERTLGGGVHGGQMALPGGRREAGESLLDCALREWREELGLGSDVVPLHQPVALTEVHVAPSRFVVRPFVAPVCLPDALNPDPLEVARVHRVALLDVMDSGRRTVQKVHAGGGQGFTIHAPGFALPRVPFIWGATAMMLAELSAWGRQWSR
ncbi:MAG: coenzyme A pyrophosphatase [Flavobacteriales bacterium]|nr:coenzyme A pyrophosphatase [Flavobacteriales bacterium]